MPRETTPVNTDANGDQTHPSFGLVRVSKPRSSGVSMFQSDLLHNETIKIEVTTASRKRDLSHDFVHSEDTIVSFEMTLAQWGAFVSSMGSGSGTPVTLRWRQGEGLIPEPPYEPRLAATIEETRTKAHEVLADIKDAFQALEDLEDSKAGIKDRRAARRHLGATIANAASNIAYVQTQMSEHAEETVAQAKADIESVIAQAAVKHGILSSVTPEDLQLASGRHFIEVPALPAGEDDVIDADTVDES